MLLQPLHGYLVRQTGGVTSKQYRKDQRYEAARDNSKEFCVVSSTGKLIREALVEFLRPVKDGTMVNRLNKELVALKQQDRTHFRGERRPDVMMTNEEANVHFRIFQFNDGVKLYDLLEHYPAPNKPMQLKTMAFPEGATHAGLTVVRTVIDFERGTYRTVSSTMSVVSKAYAETGNLPELPGLSATGTGVQTEIVCLQILFFKEQNGDLVQLRGKVHSMGILSLTQVQAPIQNQASNICLPTRQVQNQQQITGIDLAIRKRAPRRRPRREYRRVLRGEDRHVYVQLHPPPYAPAHRQRAGSTRNERGYFVFPTTAGKQDGEKVFV